MTKWSLHDGLKPMVRNLFSVEWVIRTSLIVATIAAMAYTMTARPWSSTDGREYYFQTYQFSRHLGLSGTKADLYEFKEWFEHIAKIPYDIEKIPEYPEGCGFTRVGDRYYPQHFGFYSIIASAPATVLRLLHLNEHKALNITNGILFVAMLWGVWLFWPYRRTVGLAYLICLLFSPGTLYLDWPGTEVYLCAFVTLSLVAAMSGRLKLSVLFAALASMQNQTLGLLIVMLGLLFLRQEILVFRQERRVRLREWGLMVLAGLPSLLPIGYYLVNLGAPSLLGGMEYASPAFMSVHRAWSVLMDLNQGVIVASVPVVLLAFWFGICHLFGKKVRCAWILGGTLVLCYGVGTIYNWNSGCKGIMRYATWVYCFLLVFVAANVDAVRGTGLRACLLVLLPVVTVVQFAFLPFGYLELRACASWVLTHFPALYSPDPDIFLSRIDGKAVRYAVLEKPDSIWCMYVDERGRIRKILSTYETLLSKRDVDYYVCNQAAFDKAIRKARLPASRLRYFNFGHDEIAVKMKPLSAVMFSCPDDSVRSLRGFSTYEQWGVWSTSGECSFMVSLPESRSGCKLVLNAMAYFGVRQVAVYADDRKIADWKITAKPTKPSDYEFDVPADLTGRPIVLRFKQSELVSPSEINKSSHDKRKLGLGFISLRMIRN